MQKAVGEIPLVLCALTVAEIGHGIYRANTQEIRQRRRAFLDELKATIPIHAVTERQKSLPSWAARRLSTRCWSILPAGTATRLCCLDSLSGISSRGSIGFFRNLNDRSGSQRIGQVVAHDNFHPRPDLPRFGGGFGDLLLGVGAFVEQQPGTRLQRRSEERKNAGDRGERSRSNDVGLQFFGSPGSDLDVGQFQFAQDRRDKTRFLLDRFGERELRLRQHESQWNAGESGSRSGVEYVSGVLEQPPGHYGIEYVFDRCFTRAGDAGQVEILIRLDNQREVPGCCLNDVLTMWEVGRQDLVQFVFKLHDS